MVCLVALLFMSFVFIGSSVASVAFLLENIIPVASVVTAQVLVLRSMALKVYFVSSARFLLIFGMQQL